MSQLMLSQSGLDQLEQCVIKLPLSLILFQQNNYISSAKVNAARSGMYICQATIGPKPESAEFITDSDAMMGSATVRVGKCYTI